jgi:hypothetical protein
MLLPPQQRCLSVDAPPGCEVVLNRKGERLVLNLINHYAGHPDYLPTSGDEVRLGPSDLVLRIGQTGPVTARVEPDGAEIAVIVEDGAIHLTVPSFGVHQVISIAPRSH